MAGPDSHFDRLFTGIQNIVKSHIEDGSAHKLAPMLLVANTGDPACELEYVVRDVAHLMSFGQEGKETVRNVAQKFLDDGTPMIAVCFTGFATTNDAARNQNRAYFVVASNGQQMSTSLLNLDTGDHFDNYPIFWEIDDSKDHGIFTFRRPRR